MYQKALERLIHLPTHPVRLYPLPHVVGFENHTNPIPDMISDYTFTKDAPKLATEDRHKREHDFAKTTSNFIQRNPKFTLKSDCKLTENEVSAICKVTDLSLPYPEIVLQTSRKEIGRDSSGELKADFVWTLLLAESDSPLMHESSKQSYMQMWNADYQKTFKAISFLDHQSKQPIIALDTVCYDIQFLTCNSANPDYPLKPLDYGTFRYRTLATAWDIHDEKDEFDNNKDEHLVWHVDVIAEIIKTLCIALAYPAITRTTKVAGSKPMIKPPMKNLKASSFYKRPVWEHTTLEIDLYNDTSEETDATRNSVPKRLHGVRKHLRKCQSGKLTWVKAHTRGNKRLGGLTKDYDLIT